MIHPQDCDCLQPRKPPGGGGASDPPDGCGCRANTEAGNGVDVPSPEVEAALERGETWPLIDVRSPEERVNGHIPGAQFLTVELKFQALDTWPKDTRIVFYSNAGRRSLDVRNRCSPVSSNHGNHTALQSENQAPLFGRWGSSRRAKACSPPKSRWHAGSVKT